HVSGSMAAGRRPGADRAARSTVTATARSRLVSFRRVNNVGPPGAPNRSIHTWGFEDHASVTGSHPAAATRRMVGTYLAQIAAFWSLAHVEPVLRASASALSSNAPAKTP